MRWKVDNDNLINKVVKFQSLRFTIFSRNMHFERKKKMSYNHCYFEILHNFYQYLTFVIVIETSRCLEVLFCVHENASCVILLAYLLLISWWCALEWQSFYNINNAFASYPAEFLLLKAGHNRMSKNRNNLKISSNFPFIDNL